MNHNAVNYINQQYKKIYVLTLKRLTDRHQLLAKNLAGLNYQLFYGLDKADLNMEDFVKQGIYNNEAYLQYNKDGTTIRQGVFCCAYGHKAIYEDMVHNNIQTALILEDDAFLIAQNELNVAAIFNELPKDWELLYLGYEKNYKLGVKEKIKKIWYQLLPTHALLKIKSSQFKKYYATPLSAHISNAGFHDCTHAYAITLEGAKKMIALQTPIKFKSDTLLAYGVTLNIIKGYIAKPKIFDQWSIQQQSTITSLVTE